MYHGRFEAQKPQKSQKPKKKGKAGKIVLMATHDPILALQADRRIVIRNGRISAILETTLEEKDVLLHLETMNERLLACRERLRAGLTVPSSVLYADPSPDL